MINQTFLQALQQQLGTDQILTDPAACLPYGYDKSNHHAHPDIVVFPQQHSDIETIIQLCNQFQIPITPRGLGSGTPGGAVPIKGGLVIAFEKMQQIVKIDPANRVMVVQPGITNQAVQDAAAMHGFFWPPDPSSAGYCSIGGNLAYNSAGPKAVKYGTPRENTLGLRAVTGAGQTIKTGVYTTKGTVGYDLTRLLIGSEGTLAVITEATLKLTPLPESKRMLLAIYNDVVSATNTVSQIMAQPLIPSALEFLDKHCIRLIKDYSVSELPQAVLLKDLPQQAAALLLIEVDGPASIMTEAVATIERIAKNTGLIMIITANNAKESQQLWEVRKALSPALRHVAPKKINEDIVVPVAQIPALIHGLEQLSQQYQITIVNFGHAGNGNIHVNLMIDPNDTQQAKNASACLSDVFDLALKLGGTLSGEHGIGIEKRPFMTRAIDPVSLKLMRQIKQCFDPRGILNPDKVLPLY